MKNQYKNYIIFWASQAVSQLGSSMTGFALIIWAFKQTQSAMTVSLLTFFSYLPYILVSLIAGSVVDRYKKKNVMLWSDSIAFFCTVFIQILLMRGNLQVWHIYFVNSVVGFMNAFQSPASSVAVGYMVPKDKLSNASGLNSMSSSMLTVVTPMLASFISSFWGLRGVVFIDMLTFLFAFVILLFYVKIPEDGRVACPEETNLTVDCKEGFLYLRKNKGLWYLILSNAMLNFFSRLTYENILPAMILARSGGNESALGIVSGVLGMGGIVGGLYVSFFKLPHNNVKTIYFSAAISFVFGDLFMAFGQTTLLWCIAGLAASVPIPFLNAGQNVIIYNHIESEIQGRIFAARNAVQYATIPIGILIGGFLADYIFEPYLQSNHGAALVLQKVVGGGPGSGMAVMFIISGILGFITCILWYNHKEIRKLDLLK